MKKLLFILLLLPCSSWAQSSGTFNVDLDIRAEGQEADDTFFVRTFFY